MCPLWGGCLTIPEPISITARRKQRREAGLELMCLPGQVGVPDNSNTLDNSQPKEQEWHHEEKEEWGARGKRWEVQWKRRDYLWECPYLGLSPSAPYGKMHGSDQRTTSLGSGSVPEHCLLDKSLKVNYLSSHLAMHGSAIHTPVQAPSKHTNLSVLYQLRSSHLPKMYYLPSAIQNRTSFSFLTLPSFSFKECCKDPNV